MSTLESGYGIIRAFGDENQSMRELERIRHVVIFQRFQYWIDITNGGGGEIK